MGYTKVDAKDRVQRYEQQALEAVLDRLTEKDRTFAESILAQWERSKSISDKQMYWVGVLIERVEDTTTGTMKPKDAKFDEVMLPTRLDSLFTIFANAMAADKSNPSIRFTLTDGMNIRLNMSKNKEWINVWKRTDTEEGRVWLCGVYPDGRVQKSQKVRTSQLVLNAIVEFATNPSAAGKMHGQKTRDCCFCNQRLLTTDSVFYGYGPVCAEKWGLEWGQANERLLDDELSQIGSKMKAEQVNGNTTS